MKASVSLTGLILIFVAIGCASRQISEEQIETCLTRTDWPEHNVTERAAIAWLVDYETKIKNTSCCALETRPSVLAKRGELKPLNAELLTRIDALEAMGTEEIALRLDQVGGAAALAVAVEIGERR